MIVGLGVDVVDVARFTDRLEATPGLRERLFSEPERTVPVPSLAARFAAKEATIKALGGPVGSWHDVWIERAETGQPVLHLAGAVAQRAAEMGVLRQFVSLSHDGAVATATVILEAD